MTLTEGREEAAVDAASARWLLASVRALGDALAGGEGMCEAACELDVTAEVRRRYHKSRPAHLDQPVVVDAG